MVTDSYSQMHPWGWNYKGAIRLRMAHVLPVRSLLSTERTPHGKQNLDCLHCNQNLVMSSGVLDPKTDWLRDHQLQRTMTDYGEYLLCRYGRSQELGQRFRWHVFIIRC